VDGKREWIMAATLRAAGMCCPAGGVHRSAQRRLVRRQPRTRSSGIVVASGHGWTSAGLAGPVPAPGSCHLRTAADGEPLPDPACAPGAVDPAVSDADTATTVCRKGGYTASVRPSEALTEPLKRELLAACGIPAGQISHYELDHLIDLGAGGASDLRNLWPEPNSFQQFRGQLVRPQRQGRGRVLHLPRHL
jgi:hypothetical protein